MKTELSESQRIAFASLRSGSNIFLTGKGGSGKSYLTRYIIDWARDQGRNVLVCAPTGVAATNVGGSTIHRAFGAKVGIIEPDRSCRIKQKLETLSSVDLFVIDEISMCRADLFSYVANTLLRLRSDGQKFQVLLVGDFYQLPPVLVESEQEAYSHLYGDRLYAFQVPQWHQLGIQTISLEQSMRQTDRTYVAALDNIRAGVPDFGAFAACTKVEPSASAVTICGTNDEAATINRHRLRDLAKQGAVVRTYEAREAGYPSPSDYPVDKTLTLCPGALVVMLNNDKDGRWVNGTMATVSNAEDDRLTVRIGGTDMDIERNIWHITEYSTAPDPKDPTKKILVENEKGSIEQYPVRLAWGISIHKSQGQTYDQVNVNVRSIFASGQLYVALSRCRTLEGMAITGKLTPEKAIVDRAVLTFMAGVPEQPEITAPMLPFAVDIADMPSGPNLETRGNEDRYQEGWDDGYEYRSEEVREEFDRLVDENKGLKRLSARTAREKEKAALPPEERNPRKAGRKPVEGPKRSSRSICVAGDLIDPFRALNDLSRRHPELTDEIARQCIALCTRLEADVPDV